MTLGVTHSTVVVVPDDGTSPVGSDEWNAGHATTMATNKLLGRGTAGDGAIEEITLGTNLALTGTTLNATGGAAISDGDKGDITVSGSGATWTIDTDAVTYAKMQNVSATSRFLGRITSGAGDPEELTGTQATTLLDAFTSSLKGLAPSSGGGTTNFLRADGTWAAPPGAGAGAALTRTDDTNVTLTLGGSPTVALLAATSITVGWTGLLAASRGGTNNGFTQFSGPASSAKTFTLPNSSQAIACLDLADQTVSGGANVTSQSLSTGNVTIDCGLCPLQYITNNGAFTITAPANDGSCMLLVTNGASAGAITFSGFTVGSNVGDTLTTTNGSKFTLSIWRINGTSAYNISAHQ
jgi:hypothetical protein